MIFNLNRPGSSNVGSAGNLNKSFEIWAGAQLDPVISSSATRLKSLNSAWDHWAKNFRQGIVVRTSFRPQVSRMWLDSFVDINIFVVKYYFISFVYSLHF